MTNNICWSFQPVIVILKLLKWVILYSKFQHPLISHLADASPQMRKGVLMIGKIVDSVDETLA